MQCQVTSCGSNTDCGYCVPGMCGSNTDCGYCVPGMEPGAIDWIATEIEVKIKETHDDSSLIHQIGVIRSISVREHLL